MPASPRGRAIALLGIALGLALLLTLAALPALVEAWARAALHARGVRTAQLHVASLRPGGAVVEGIALGSPPDLRIEKLSIDWTPRALLAGRIDSASAEGIVLRGAQDASGRLDFGEVDALLAGGGGSLPRALSLRGARAELALHRGSVALDGSLDAASEGAAPQSLRGELAISGDLLVGEISGEWAATGPAALRGSLRATREIELPFGTAREAALSFEVSADRAPSESSSLASAAAWREAFVGQASARFSARELRDGTGSVAREVAATATALAQTGRPISVSTELALELRDIAARAAAAFDVARDRQPAPPLLVDLHAEASSDASAPAVAALDGVFRLLFDDASVRIEAAEPARLALASSATAQGLALHAPFATAVAPLSLAISRSTRTLTASAELAPARLSLLRGGTLFVRGTSPRLSLDLDTAGDAVAVRWAMHGGDLSWPGQATRLSAMAANGSIESLASARWGSVRVAHARLADLSAAPSYAPIEVRGEIAQLAGPLSLRGVLKESEHAGEIAFALAERTDGRVRFSGFDFALGPARFDARRRNLSALLPGTAGMLDSLAGELAWRGAVLLPERGEAEWTGRLTLAGISARAGDLRVEGLEGELAIESLGPLRIAPSSLSFARANLASELTAGTARIELNGDALLLHGLTARALGGALVAEVRTDLARGSGDVAARFAGISIEQLARTLEIESLTADGALSGELGVAFGADGLSARSGALRADGPGLLRYRPSAAPVALRQSGGEEGVLLSALSDFRFVTLTAELDASAERSAVVRLALDGRNPSLQGGRPIELRARIEAPLSELVALGGTWQRWLRALGSKRGLEAPPRGP